MLKEQAKLLNKIAITTDLASLVAAFVLSYNIRSLSVPLPHFIDFLWILCVIIPIWYFLLYRYNIYAPLRVVSLQEIFLSIVKVQLTGGIILSAIIFFFQPTSFRRIMLSYFLVLSFVFLVLERTAIKIFLSNIRKRGYNFRNIMVVGTDKKALEFIRLVEKHCDWGLKVIGLLKLAHGDPVGQINSYKIMGRVDDLVDICKEMPVDEVVFCVPPEALPNLEDYVRDMEEMGITVRMVLDFYDLKRSKRELSLFHGQVPILTFYSRSFDSTSLFIKRCLDILGSIIGLLITTVLFPFVALAIRLDSPGPLLFGQKRVGKMGRVFTCWKFRSMYIDAEERKKELMHLNEMNGALFKIKDDPRITKVGKFLRKTSLDELPQFWNVLKGEMSLVGTRPPTPDEVAGYQNWHRKRICIKPGMTGMWQVSGRNRVQDFDDVAGLDIEYIERWSLWLDVKILFKTVWVVFAGSGSC